MGDDAQCKVGRLEKDDIVHEERPYSASHASDSCIADDAAKAILPDIQRVVAQHHTCVGTRAHPRGQRTDQLAVRHPGAIEPGQNWRCRCSQT